MADDITDPKRKDDTAAPETTTPESTGETPASDAAPPAADAATPAAEAGTDKPVSESQFTQDPLKTAAGVTQAPDDTAKPDREPAAPEAQAETPAPAATDSATATAPADADADKPKDDAPQAPEAAAPDEEDKDKPKEDAPAAPTAQTEETEEEKEKRKKAEAQAAAPQQPAAPQDEALTDKKLEGTQYQTTLNDIVNSKLPILFAQKHMPVLNEVWGIGTVDPELVRAIGEDGEIRKHKNGLLFNLPNGHTIEWHHNLGGAEFIGMPRARSKFDEIDAHAVVAASKSRGWQAINVHGTVEQKEMLWLEAQRQNMGVANFQPTEDSAVYQQWLKESTKKLDDQLTGISAAEHGEQRVPKDFIYEAAKPIDEQPETPEEPAKPEAKTPEVKTPEAAAPEKTPEVQTPETPATPQGESNFEEFLNRRASVETDPNVQKDILAIREQVKQNPSIDTKEVENILGDKPDPEALGKVSKFFEARSTGGNTPAAEVKPTVATVETPATQTPAKATTKPKVAAPGV